MVFSEPLVVKTVHLHEKANATEHHTQDYDLVHLEPPTPVLRRGQPFNLSLSFNRPYDDSKDIVRLLFSFGSNPSPMKGTRGVNTVTNRNNFLPNLEAWAVRMIGCKGQDVSVEVRSPVDSPVGVWRLTIETTTAGLFKKTKTHKEHKDIYLLFNPWLKEDDVYMENQGLLDEYVCHETGKIWCGDERSARGRQWVFGQFDACVLPACQLMLERSGIKDIFRGDPIKVSRFITKIVNWNDDDGGVLAGRWDGKYSDGTAPAAWTGSVPILKKFLETKNTVRYGQCWVFAGVVTTVCRALGLPSRVVTNVVSAHDVDGSLSIDRYYKSETNGFEGDDSIWNFHVWNDVWMARPDLPKGYGGWQAIDATPQETSDGLFQCGPTSVEAIKRGAVGYNYDVGFMLATVNADVIQWVEDKKSESGLRRVYCNKSQVGRMILTKAPFLFDPNGDRDREDITRTYKDEEGTREERSSLHRAARSIARARELYDIPNCAEEDVEFKLVDLDRVKIGEPFALTVYIENKSTKPRSIHANLSIRSVYYNGVNANLVGKATSDLVIQPGEREELKLTVKADEYMDKLVEYCMMKLCAVAEVEETRQVWADEDDFQVLKPIVNIKTDEKLSVGKQGLVEMSFTNPLDTVLTKCVLNYAGPGLEKHYIIPFEDIKPREAVSVKYHVTPQKAGEQHIVITFTSEELLDVTGSATVKVLEKED